MLGREAAVVLVAKRPSERRSRERSTCLAWRVFICVSRQKWGVAWPATGQMTYFGSWMAEIGSIPTKTTVCVCVSPATKEQIKFVYFVPKWLRAKILNENWRCRVAKKRPKPVWILNIDHRKGDIYIRQWRGKGSLLTNILCRNWADKNETVVRKILELRESFAASRVHWSQDRRDKVRKKYMYWRRNLQQQTCAVRSVWSVGIHFDRQSTQWLSPMKKHLKLLFSRRKMWR